MAWNNHWQVCFKSRTGTQYAVNIYEQGYSGSVVRLTGATDPFVTQEDNDDNIFTPIRTQTGYLRVIDETQDGSLLESIMPNNNTEKLVRLYSGTYSNGVFTEGAIKWQGFLCAEAFTQPWDNQKKQIEFPVKSMLAALEDVQLQDSTAGYEKNIAYLIVMAFNSLNVTPSTVQISSQLTDVQGSLLNVLLQFMVFFNEETINNEGDSYKQLVGVSYFDALSYICSLYGIMMREVGTTICLSSYDKQDARIFTTEFTWGQIVNISTGMQYLVDPVVMPETAMLPALNFRGANNVVGFVQGGKSAKIVLNINDKTFYLDLPQTTETTDTPVEIDLEEGNGKLYVQIHSIRYLRENFFFYEYEGHTVVGSSTYEDMVECLAITGYSPNPYAISVNLFTGAFPVRFFHQEDNETIVLKSGIYLNTQYLTPSQTSTTITYAPCYSVSSLVGINATQGWLNIKFLLQELVYYSGQTSPGNYIFGNLSQFYAGEPVRSEVRMCIQVGNLFWNGTDWVSGSVPDTYFWFRTRNGEVPNNKTSDMNTDVDDGYFIPITRPLAGIVTFHILNGMVVTHGDTPTGADRLYCYTHILSDLNISHILPRAIVQSERRQNTYRKTILQSGFREEKEIELTIGTMNNNLMSSSFIKKNSTDFIESFLYHTASSFEAMRPEMHMLNRMVAQYGEVRRTFKGVVSAGIELLNTRYTYLGRAFFGIDAQHRWRDEEQEVKFIEVS